MTATQLLKSVNNKKHILIDLDTSVETAYYSPREIWIWLSYSQGKSPSFWTKERLWGIRKDTFGFLRQVEIFGGKITVRNMYKTVEKV